MAIYKVLSAEDWRSFEHAGSYDGSSDDKRDGFIHFSKADQLAVTLEKYYSGMTGLILLWVDEEACGPDLKWEPSRDGALFPHLYGPLDLKAVSQSAELLLDEAGRHILPDHCR